MEHKYYIVKCYNEKYEFNDKYLEFHLKKLNVLPDENAMDIIKVLDLDVYKKNNKNINTYCDFDRNNFIKLPFFEKNIFTADVFFLSINSDFVNKRFYNFKKYLVNICNLPSIVNIIDKSQIINEINKINPLIVKKYIPKTFPINDKKEYEFPKWYILRPIDSFGGSAIKYVNSKEKLEDAIEYYNVTKNYKNIVHASNVIASEYISNPLLFRSKKFHLRLYYVISLINNVFNSFLWDFGKIMTAKKEFDMIEPFLMDKHDTHFKSTDDDYFYPNDFKVKSEINTKIFNKIKLICEVISKIIIKSKDKLLYPNEKNMYYLFGLDIMITDNFEPVFIEINQNPNLEAKKNSVRDMFSKKYYQWINDIIFEPLFKYNDAMSARKHYTYLNI